MVFILNYYWSIFTILGQMINFKFAADLFNNKKYVALLLTEIGQRTA